MHAWRERSTLGGIQFSMGSAGGMHAEERLAQMESRERALSTQTFAGRHTVACVRTCLQKLLWRAS